ncbi:hypothetical protein [Paenibacillus nasutitermitis]|uniref:Uncharacterized protein n=1 Tax=Paenibacillus nasutitermitis TaxID=1652958 RepID=A0A916YQX5_9BACL|nr:hypothetical protein [Paenibacillus nasutitermitis]GGD56912.1 hypothetical protein GCM10010911_13330 [Paenibacillus nasutitermitis]
MYQTPKDFMESARLVNNSTFPKKEKIRHCRELLRHMQSQYKDQLKLNNEASQVYHTILSMIKN